MTTVVWSRWRLFTNDDVAHRRLQRNLLSNICQSVACDRLTYYNGMLCAVRCARFIHIGCAISKRLNVLLIQPIHCQNGKAESQTGIVTSMLHHPAPVTCLYSTCHSHTNKKSIILLLSLFFIPLFFLSLNFSYFLVVVFVNTILKLTKLFVCFVVCLFLIVCKFIFW